MSDVYKSSTLGAIPLSFTGRHLLQSLREAVVDAIEHAHKAGRDGRVIPSNNWHPISLARGKLAQYMSKLERNRQFGAFGWRDPEPLDVALKRQEEAEGEEPPIFGAFRQLVVAMKEQDEQPSREGYHMHLPPIPPGYALHVVGNIMTIEPLKEETKNEERPHEYTSKAKGAYKQKDVRDELADRLNEYRDSLLAKVNEYDFDGHRQERIDKARLAIFDLVEKALS